MIVRYIFSLLIFLCINFVILKAGELKIGDSAPDFTLDVATKDTVLDEGFTLSKHFGNKPIVLAFYPADWSGGCTKEMCTMRDNFSDLQKLNAEIVGISGDYVYSHKAWAKNLELPFFLASDFKHDVAKSYNSFNDTAGFNKRTVYVIDTKGKIAYIDLEYKARDTASFNKLKDALEKIQ